MEDIQNKAPKNDAQLIVNNITIKPITRKTSDIDRWRTALSAADRGKRQELYKLYEDLLLDNILSEAITKRITAITNAEITFTRNDGTEEAIDNLIDTTEFERLLTEIMLSKFWGISVTELEFSEEGITVHPIPRRHIRPATGMIAREETDEGDIPYREDDFILEAGDADDLGLILKAAPFVIYKRNNIGDWAQYAEVFGMPIRVFKYATFDEAARIELTKAAEAAGSNPIVVIPDGSDFEVKPGAASGDGSVYDKLRQACNEEILVGMLGQTMTTLSGEKGARSLGEVHMQVQEDKHKADRRFVQRILNSKLIPMLEKRGFPAAGGYFYFPDQGEAITLNERMTITEKAARMVPVSAQYVYDTFGVPRPDEGEELVSVPEPAAPDLEPADPDDPTEPDGRNFIERVCNFFVGAPAMGAATGADSRIADEAGDDFNTRLIKRAARGQAAYFDAELFAKTAGDLILAFHAGWRRQGGGMMNSVDYGAADPVVLTAMETNLYHFSAAKTLTQVQQLNEAYRKSASFEEYMTQARKVTEVFNEKWARTEYETAGHVAESTSTYYRLQRQADLFPYWEYRTAGDDKVRPEHAALNGLILPANDPRWQQIYPPNGWACRCYVVPRMRHEVEGVDLQQMRTRADDYFSTAEYKTAAAQGFGVNRAELKQVFTANQQYIRKFPQKAAKYLNRIGADDYNLPTVAKRKAATGAEMPRYDNTAAEWFAQRQREGVVTLTDRDGRSISLTQKTYRSHTTGSHANRADYLQALPETIRDPDEIWINTERGKSAYENYTMIRYYKDEVLVVCCRIINGRMNEVRSWFPLTETKQVRNSYRRGLLIYSKKPRCNPGLVRANRHLR